MSENLLVNPGFEGEFETYQGIGEVQAPGGWTPYWLEGDPPQEQSQGPLARHEMTGMLASQFSTRVRSGAKAVRWFTQWKVHQGGLCQRVPVTVGQWYRLSAWVHAWCSQTDDPNSSEMEMYAGLGIDPDGKTNARRRGVVWTPWNYIGWDWLKIVTEPVKARSVDLTVYVETWNKWRAKHADAYVDDCSLVQVEFEQPAPSPPPVEPPPSGECGINYETIRAIVREENDKTVLGSLGSLTTP